jgi:hypothetical protein
MVEAMGRSTPCHHKKSDGIRTEKIDFVLTQICDIATPPRSDPGLLLARRGGVRGCCVAENLPDGVSDLRPGHSLWMCPINFRESAEQANASKSPVSGLYNHSELAKAGIMILRFKSIGETPWLKRRRETYFQTIVPLSSNYERHSLPDGPQASCWGRKSP